MSPFATVLLLTLAPTVGTLLGGLLGRRMALSSQTLSFVLHLAAGVVLGVVGVELMPRALEAEPIVVLVTFPVGGLFYIATGSIAEALSRRLPLGGADAATGAIVAGVGFDLLTDGVMVAAGVEAGEGLGVLLAISLFITDAPEAFSTVAALRGRLSGRAIWTVVLVFPALVLLGAPLGYALLAGRSEEVQLGLLSFTAGMLVLVVIEGLVPEAHAHGRRESEKASALFIAGFTAFAFLSLYVG